MPVFDEFREVFIVTEGKESFYMDIEGNYDQSLGHQILWSAAPTSVKIVRPFLIGFLENEQIEVKHLIAPQVITQRIELISSSICNPYSVSINSSTLKVLDSMFLVLADSKELKTRVLVKLQ